jgi:signal transduction histidine kinase
VLDSLRIRSKLAVAIAIPLFALIASSSLAITAANRRSRDAAAVAESAESVSAQVGLVSAANGPSGILTTLNAERALEAVVLIGLDPAIMGQGSTEAGARQNTDRALAQFRTAIAEKPADVRQNYRAALESLDHLPELRTRGDALTERSMANVVTASALFDDYTALTQAVFDANTRSANGVANPDLAAGVRFVDQLTRYNDNLAVADRVVGGSVAFSHVSTLRQDFSAATDAAGIVRMMAGLRADMEKSENPFYADVAHALFTNPSLSQSIAMLDGAIDGQPISIDSLIENTEGTAAIASSLNRAAEHLQADVATIRAAADQEAADAAAQTNFVLAITGLALLLGGVVTVVASRSITQPLTRLIGSAETMATKDLPAAVKHILETPPGEDVELPDVGEVEGSGGIEVGEMADALNTVQRSAVGLAVEQAVLRRNIADAFVNLGRRNQNLMNRLLQSITDMEKREPDPDLLEQLFGLDHLATRMRRNAESLVILAGGTSRRQWSAPVPIGQVVRGAFGEVEHYERAEIVHLDEALITGSTVVEVTHLVAELLENAITYSPPTRRVEIRGTARSNGYELTIVDRGLGMKPEELALANSRVSGDESFTVAPSRYLGHYVIGRQASRLGVRVVLHETPGGGITASIDLAAVLADPATTPSMPMSSTAPTGFSPPSTTDEPAPAPDRAVSALVAAAEIARTGTPEHTVAAPAPTGPQPTAPATTKSGYARRVRGANTPTTEVALSRDADASAAPRPMGAEGMRSVLSSVQAGMNRGRSEARHERTADDEGTDEQ